LERLEVKRADKNLKTRIMDKLQQEIIKNVRDPFVTSMFERYKEIPTDLKYKFIEKDYTKMFGKAEGLNRMRHMYDDSETFIFAFENALCEFSKRIKKNLLKKYFEDLALDEYYGLQDKGFFFEFFPNLSGNYLRDKEFFLNFIAERENKKGYVKLILED
jgi:hypothetical protein